MTPVPSGKGAERGWALAAWGAAALFFLVHAATLTSLPDVYGDETEEVLYARTLALTGRPGFPTYEGLFSPSFNFLTNAWPHSARLVYTGTLAASFRFFGAGLWQGRLPSLLAAAWILFLVGWTSRRVFGPAATAAAVLFLCVDPIFGLSGHVARPDMLSAAAGLTAWVLWLHRESLPGASFLAGAIAGLSPGVHTNGLVFLPVLAAAVTLSFKRERTWAYAALSAALGTAAGLAFFALVTRWDDFIPGWMVWRGYWGHIAPILEPGGLLPGVLKELDRYLRPDALPQTLPTGLFQWGLRAEYFAAAAALLALLPTLAENYTSALLVTTVAILFGGMAALVGFKHPAYSLIPLPFLALAVGAGFQKITSWRPGTAGGRRKRWAALGGLALLGGLAACGGLRHQAGQYARPTHYAALCASISREVPLGASVLGPGQFWLGVPGRTWHNANVPVSERWLTNSSAHMAPLLERLRPDYILMDRQLENVLRRAEGLERVCLLAPGPVLTDETTKEKFWLLKVLPPDKSKAGEIGKLKKFRH